jgi:hypothetical protein
MRRRNEAPPLLEEWKRGSTSVFVDHNNHDDQDGCSVALLLIHATISTRATRRPFTIKGSSTMNKRDASLDEGTDTTLQDDEGAHYKL